MLKKVFVHAKKEDWEEDYSYHFFNTDMTDYGYIFLNTVDIKIDEISEIDLKKLHIEALKKNELKIRADFQIALERNQERINNLLSLEDKSNG